MKILVTGHKGYIGARLVPFLLDAGHDVIGLDCNYYRDSALADLVAPTATLTLDVRRVTGEALRGVDAVVHLAALSNDPMGDMKAQWTDAINHRATLRLAALAKEAGVTRFVFYSSCSIYGASDPDSFVDETAPLQPLSAYAVSKVESERGLSALASANFAPVFLRHATAFGLSPMLRLDLVVNNLCAWAHTSGAIRLLSDGRSWRPLVHVEDICRATLAVLTAPHDKVSGEAFNIGLESENHRVLDLAEMVKAAYPHCQVTKSAEANPDPRSYRVSFAKFHRAFPQAGLCRSVMSGITELAAALSHHAVTAEDFAGRRFMRVKQLTYLIENQKVDEDLYLVGGAT